VNLPGILLLEYGQTRTDETAILFDGQGSQRRHRVDRSRKLRITAEADCYFFGQLRPDLNNCLDGRVTAFRIRRPHRVNPRDEILILNNQRVAVARRSQGRLVDGLLQVVQRDAQRSWVRFFLQQGHCVRIQLFGV
jgi:hypothetical protein